MDVAEPADVTDDVQQRRTEQLEMLTFQQKAGKRGRPRGTTTTNIMGLPKGKQVKPFLKKSMREKEEILTNIFIKPAVRGKKRVYESDDIRDFTDVSSAVCDTDIDIGLLSARLTDSAREKAVRITSTKRGVGEYMCPICTKICGNSEGDPASVGCDSCKEWLHLFPCSGERRQPKSKHWFCAACKPRA